MKYPQTHLKQSSLLLCNNTAKLLFVALSLVICSSSIADANADNTKIAYVDSVHQWGPWELDIEPAAGGLQPPTTRAINARDSKVSLRINSVSALAPQDRTPVIFVPSPTPTPTPAPPLPVTPPIPPGKGGPSDGLF